MTQIGRQFLWPDATGTPTDCDTAFATVGAGPVYEIELENELVLYLSCSAGPPRAFEVMVEACLDGTNWVPWIIKAAQCSAAATEIVGVSVAVPQRCQIRVSARRFGGTVNTRLTIAGWARQCLTAPLYHGQPVELANHHEDGVECWGTGAGAHDHPAAGPAAYAAAPAGDPPWIPTGEADTLVIEYTVSTVAASSIDFEVQESTDDGVTSHLLPVASLGPGGMVTGSAEQGSYSGAIGTHITRPITVQPGTAVLVLAQRTGGGATTGVLAYARLYKRGGAGSGAAAGVAAGASFGAPTLCFSAVAPGLGAKTLAATPTWDDSDEASNRWIAIPAGTKTIRFRCTTSGTAPTALELLPYWSPDGGTTPYTIECTDSVSASCQQVSPLYCSYRGQRGAATLANGTYYWTLTRGPDGQVPSRATHIEIQACRSGGAADTALLAYVEFEG